MNLLILSPNQIKRYNWSHQLFRNEFSKHHNTTYYGEGFPNYIPNKPIPELIKELGNIDLIMTYGMKYTFPFQGLGEINNIPKVHIVVDYFADGMSGTYEKNHELFNRDKYDLYFAVVSHEVRNLEKNKVCDKAFLLPFSIDIDIYKKLDIPKLYDVFCVFSKNENIYPNRVSVQNMVRSLQGKYKTFTGKTQHEDYIQKMNESNVCITSNNRFKSLSIKYYETLACGSLLLADEPEDFDMLGFSNGVNCVLYKGLYDLQDKIYFYVKNDNVRERIAKNGYEFVRKYHNNSVRVEQFTNIVKKELGIK